MAKFRCTHSGNVIEFTAQYDIDSMKGHPDYIPLDDAGNAITENEQPSHIIPLKPPIKTASRGRPRKNG